MSRGHERGVQPVHRSGPGEPRRGLWISEEPHSLCNGRFILIFFLFFCGYFQLFIDFWILVVAHQWFYWTSNLNFQRSLGLSPGPKAVLFRLAKFLLEALHMSTSVSRLFPTWALNNVTGILTPVYLLFVCMFCFVWFFFLFETFLLLPYFSILPFFLYILV